MSDRPVRILLGVTGGVGAFKSILLLRLMRLTGWEVQVVMTESATKFVGKATFHALSGRPVHTDLWALDQTQGGELHVELSAWADAMIVYPATANYIGGVAASLADDLLKLTTACFAGPVVICPAMHTRMVTNPLQVKATAALREVGYTIVPPVEGMLANGEVGPGRLPEPEAALEALLRAMGPQDLAGRRIVVSAGPTREALDPVRFLSNPSTGKMGYAVARVAARRGAEVTLVTGPVDLPCPPGLERVPVTTAAEMAGAVRAAAKHAHVVVMAAAVADYRPATSSGQKMAKGAGPLTVELERTEDILAGLAADAQERILVGFAMETGDLLAKARAKLQRKDLDLLVANDLTVPGAGFAVDTNVVTILHRDGRTEELPRQGKDQVAGELLDRIAALLQ
jgi:phosphopantothenoylcysteine decarboxylase / phosphopantothenate---cysteine ligase